MNQHRPTFFALRVFAFASLAAASFWSCADAEPANEDEVARAKAAEWRPIELDDFDESLHHSFRRERDYTPDYARYDPAQIVHIAENLIAWQNPDGGWPKNEDWLRVLDDEEERELVDEEEDEDSTLDNGATWSQVEYLAKVHAQTGIGRYADASRDGVRYILSQQKRSGGWEGPDSESVTFNDNVMTGVMMLLHPIVHDRELYGFVEGDLLDDVRDAYDEGIRCVLDCQIEVDGRLTAWAQHHDHETLEPTWGRSFEPPAIVSNESVGVVRMLMAIESPSPEILRAVESAVDWFEQTRIDGLRVEQIDVADEDYKFHLSETDKVLVRDENARPVWPRFTDLETGEPIFCNRDRRIVRDFEDLERERRTGYQWFGHTPIRLLEKDYPAWRERLEMGGPE